MKRSLHLEFKMHPSGCRFKVPQSYRKQEYKLLYSLCNKSHKFGRYFGTQDCFCCVLFIVHDEISLDSVFLALPLCFWYFYLCLFLQMKFPISDKNDWTELNHVTIIIQRCAQSPGSSLKFTQLFSLYRYLDCVGLSDCRSLITSITVLLLLMQEDFSFLKMKSNSAIWIKCSDPPNSSGNIQP